MLVSSILLAGDIETLKFNAKCIVMLNVPFVAPMSMCHLFCSRHPQENRAHCVNDYKFCVKYFNEMDGEFIRRQFQQIQIGDSYRAVTRDKNQTQ